LFNESLEFVGGAKAGTFIGFMLLLVTSIFLFNAIERSFNLVWKVERYRSLTQRFIIFTAILFLGPILIGLSIYITAKIQVQDVILRLTSSPITREIPISGFLSQFMDTVYNTGNVVIPYLLMFFILMILYMAIPNTRVERWAAFFGAAFAALCWELSKWGFGYFAKSMIASREKIYASLAVFLVFLIWMYLVCVIILFGAELSYVIQHYRHLVRVDPRHLRPVNDAYLACRAVLNIAHRYLKGEELPGIPELAAKFSVSIPQMRSVINRLAGAKILVRIGSGAGDSKEVYEPNRELNQITLGQVIEAAAPDSFFKTNHSAVEKSNIRREGKGLDPFDEGYRAYLNDLFMEVQGNARETFSQISLRDLILTKTGEPDTQ
jgi:membrane protein